MTLDIGGGQGTGGVPKNGGRKYQLVRSCFALDSLHAQTLMMTDVQTPFHGTPLVPLEAYASGGVETSAVLPWTNPPGREGPHGGRKPSRIYIYIYIYVYIYVYIYIYIYVYVYIYIYICMYIYIYRERERDMYGNIYIYICMSSLFLKNSLQWGKDFPLT